MKRIVIKVVRRSGINFLNVESRFGGKLSKLIKIR